MPTQKHLHDWRHGKENGIEYRECKYPFCKKRAAVHPHTANSYVWEPSDSTGKFLWCKVCHTPRPVFGRPVKVEAVEPPAVQASLFAAGGVVTLEPRPMLDEMRLDMESAEVTQVKSKVIPITDAGGGIIFACARTSSRKVKAAQ